MSSTPQATATHSLQVERKPIANIDDEDDEGLDPQQQQPSGRVVKPYIMDLESTNGTMLNGSRIESRRLGQDVL